MNRHVLVLLLTMAICIPGLCGVWRRRGTNWNSFALGIVWGLNVAQLLLP